MMAIVNFLIPFTAGFTTSMLLYEPTHSDDFPELGRYSIGFLMICACAKAVGVPDEWVAKILMVGGACGLGVALARVTR